MGGQRRRWWPIWTQILLLACSADKATSHTVSTTGAGDGGSLQSGNGGGQPNGFSNAATGAPAMRRDASTPMLVTSCVGQTQHAQPVEVDMYVMLDRSDSMRETTGAGNTKWDAIREALTTFVQDPQSSGLGVGLQYFPIGSPGVPESCKSDADCGSTGGPCMLKACLPPRPPLAIDFTQCVTDADCPLVSPGCAPFGTCSMNDKLACFTFAADGCGTDGACTPVTGECLAYASCMPSDYQGPAVPIDLLPANAPALTSSLMAEMPTGATPTPPALAGAINHAAAHAMQNPSHRVIAVLATDGLPTDCLPSTVRTQAQAVTTVANIASQGAALMPSVQTYVIGVFSPTDTGAMANLDRWASAGGTAKAFIVDVSKNVSQQLLDALAKIRGGTLSCDFDLPAAPTGQTVDFKLVNVELTESGKTQTLPYVKQTDQCSKANLGWFYDVPPEQGTPTKISVCPHTCDTLQAAGQDAVVEVRLGCATMGPI